jgi:hypothetical protein
MCISVPAVEQKFKIHYKSLALANLAPQARRARDSAGRGVAPLGTMRVHPSGRTSGRWFKTERRYRVIWGCRW